MFVSDSHVQLSIQGSVSISNNTTTWNSYSHLYSFQSILFLSQFSIANGTTINQARN